MKINNILKKYFKALRIITFSIGITIILDTFILKQTLKNLMVKANTSSISPYNSDGVLNIFIIFVFAMAFPLILSYIIKKLQKKENNKKT